ncbi:MAG: hypothetical protein N2578_05570 [Bdellovibrionaceae bacterium]|nr:hypothetical protein [Pseudobdellovibrionaceae bacterium]
MLMFVSHRDPVVDGRLAVQRFMEFRHLKSRLVVLNSDKHIPAGDVLASENTKLFVTEIKNWLVELGVESVLPR